MTVSSSVPVCLVMSGHDPCGGAGLQADIEAVASMGAHAVTVPTATTVQDTSNATALEPMPAEFFLRQARKLVADIKINAIKIGLVPGMEIAAAIHQLLVELQGIPVVLDPVLEAGGGHRFLQADARDFVQSMLFPLLTVVTPNVNEARELAGNADTLDACGMSLLESGTELVLITGEHEGTGPVINKLYGNNRCLEQFQWQRIQGQFHGTGCTLSSAIAGLLCHGHEPHSAIREAQQYTWETIRHARQIGRGQWIPNRLYWADRE